MISSNLQLAHDLLHQTLHKYPKHVKTIIVVALASRAAILTFRACHFRSRLGIFVKFLLKSDSIDIILRLAKNTLANRMQINLQEIVR